MPRPKEQGEDTPNRPVEPEPAPKGKGKGKGKAKGKGDPTVGIPWNLVAADAGWELEDQPLSKRQRLGD